MLAINNRIASILLLAIPPDEEYQILNQKPRGRGHDSTKAVVNGFIPSVWALNASNTLALNEEHRTACRNGEVDD